MSAVRACHDPPYIRSVAQPGSAPGLGPGGRRFESYYSDQSYNGGRVVKCNGLQIRKVVSSNLTRCSNKYSMTIYFQNYCEHCRSSYNRTQEAITPGFCSRNCEIAENTRLNQKSFVQQHLEELRLKRTPHDAQDHSMGLPPTTSIPVNTFTRKREYVCACCSISDHMGKPLKLKLHHLNGNDKDFAPDNVQLLCPNCHSQQ